MEYTLRQAKESDFEFVYRVTEVSMRDYVEQTFGPWITEDQRKIIEASFDPGTHRIITVEGNPVGVLATRAHDSYVQLEKLYLLPEFQRHGIGSEILRELARAASESGTPIHLRVLNSNLGARQLYERFGFTVVRETAERRFMEYHA